PENLHTWDDYLRVPVLTKAELRAHAEELLSWTCERSRLFRKKTSGSTGVALEVFVDPESLQWKRACTLRSDEWSGWRLGERVAKLSGNPDFLQRGWRGRLRNALLERARYLDTLKMDEAALETFARSLLRRPASLLFGHAHSIFLFAEFLRARGIEGIR